MAHDYLLNFDSYTGSMLHNYYLYEKDGAMSMIAWDYNLAFGAFSMGGDMGGGPRGDSSSTKTTTETATETATETTDETTTDRATTLVNCPIDTPVSGAAMEERPLLNRLLSDETYLGRYHSLFGEFIEGYFESGDFEKMYDGAVALIAPYVEKDPTSFCTYDEFEEANEALRGFCLLRAESVKGQLDGSIASTSEAQAASREGFVDASHIDVDAMGSNRMGFGRPRNFGE